MFKKFRKEKGITQVELADKLGVSQSTIAMWETGRATPSLATMQKISEALNCDLIEVVDCFKKGA